MTKSRCKRLQSHQRSQKVVANDSRVFSEAKIFVANDSRFVCGTRRKDAGLAGGGTAGRFHLSSFILCFPSARAAESLPASRPEAGAPPPDPVKSPHLHAPRPSPRPLS